MSQFLAESAAHNKKISEQQGACGAEWTQIKKEPGQFDSYLEKARAELDSPVTEDELRKLLRELNAIVKEQATHLLSLVPGNKFVYSFALGERTADHKTKLLAHAASDFPQFNPIIVANPGSASFGASSADETMAMAEESTQVALQAVAAVQAKKAYGKLQKEYELATMSSAKQAISLLGNARNEGQKFVQENSQGLEGMETHQLSSSSSSSSSSSIPPIPAISSPSVSGNTLVVGDTEINLDAVIEAAEEAKQAAISSGTALKRKIHAVGEALQAPDDLNTHKRARIEPEPESSVA